ncbi:unnamed protein product [Rotaria sordida]|uniref:Uncharacterized protein n=1 Tax=Rotaria sordida TaxID=392033 RepID=A0A818Y8W3_9BILA|nr:unnamed protein product [Rotaria sordida]
MYHLHCQNESILTLDSSLVKEGNFIKLYELEQTLTSNLEKLKIEDTTMLQEKIRRTEQHLGNSDATGVGKSTIVQFLAGTKIEESQLKVDQEQCLKVLARVESIKNSELNIITSHPLNKLETRHIIPITIQLKEIFGHYEDGEIILCVAPDFSNSSIPEIDIVNGIEVIEALKECRSIKILALLSYDRQHDILKLMHNLHMLQNSFEEFQLHYNRTCENFTQRLENWIHSAYESIVNNEFKHVTEILHILLQYSFVLKKHFDGRIEKTYENIVKSLLRHLSSFSEKVECLLAKIRLSDNDIEILKTYMKILRSAKENTVLQDHISTYVKMQEKKLDVSSQQTIRETYGENCTYFNEIYNQFISKIVKYFDEINERIREIFEKNGDYALEYIEKFVFDMEAIRTIPELELKTARSYYRIVENIYGYVQRFQKETEELFFSIDHNSEIPNYRRLARSLIRLKNSEWINRVSPIVSNNSMHDITDELVQYAHQLEVRLMKLDLCLKYPDHICLAKEILEKIQSMSILERSIPELENDRLDTSTANSALAYIKQCEKVDHVRVKESAADAYEILQNYISEYDVQDDPLQYTHNLKMYLQELSSLSKFTGFRSIEVCIDADSFYQAEQSMDNLSCIQRELADIYASDSISKKSDELKKKMDDIVNTILNRYDSMNVEDYPFHSPNDLLKKLETVALRGRTRYHQTRISVLRKIQQNFNRAIDKLHDVPLDERPAKIRSLNYILCFLPEELQAPFKSRIDEMSQLFTDEEKMQKRNFEVYSKINTSTYSSS